MGMEESLLAQRGHLCEVDFTLREIRYCSGNQIPYSILPSCERMRDFLLVFEAAQ